MRLRRGVRLSAFLTVALSFLFVSIPGLASTVVSCSFAGSPEDRADSGIVVTSYPGNNVRRLHIGYGTDTTGQYLITAQLRRGGFDGPIVGSSSIYLHLDDTASTDVDGFFHFGGVNDGAPITPGDTLTITHTWSGPGILFFDAGRGAFDSSGSCGGAYETIGTSPPLDVQVRGTMGIEIEQEDLTTPCIKSDTVLCIQNSPGDARFQLTVDFNHSGTAGTGQASLQTLGIAHGGSFWFFGQDNPEILVKVLNGCTYNNHFWVFITAGTNVGFTVHVKDTATSVSKSYANQDNVAAVPVQDIEAFPCP